MNKIRAAVVGVGHLGQHHARIYHAHPDVELVGVVDIDERRAAKFARKYDCEYHDTLTPFLDRIDVASVVVPTALHYPVTKTLMDHGIHALVEKPFTRTVQEAEELLAMQKKAKVLLQVGHVERFNPAIRAVKDLVVDPAYVEVHRLCPYNPRGTDVGVILDLMIHDIDILLDLVPSPIRDIRAVGVGVVSANEDLAQARLEFANGCVANIAASKIGNKEMRKIRIFQPSAYISLDYQKQSGLTYTMEGGRVRRRKIPLAKDEPLRLEIDSFLDCVRANRDPEVSGTQAKQALEVAFAIIRKIRQHNELRTAGKSLDLGVRA